MKELRYSLKEISSELAISVRELRKFINSGELNAIKAGRAFAVSYADLDDFLNTQFPISTHFSRECNRSLESAMTAGEQTYDSDTDLLLGDTDIWFARTPVWV